MTDYILPAGWWPTTQSADDDRVWSRVHETPDGKVTCTVRLTLNGAEGQVVFAKPRDGARSTTRRASSDGAWAVEYCAAWCDGFVDAWLWELRGPAAL
jgi:hypothetical protein